MSTIEKAAQRLEELRRAGVEIPTNGAAALGRQPAQASDAIPLPERAVRAIESAASPARSAAPVAATGAGARTATRSAARADVPAIEIDLARLRQAGMVTPDAPGNRIADEYRLVKRPLLDNMRGRTAAPVERANLVMITSATPGEGKTFTAVNLALSIAMELDNTVLLVDADVAHPSIPSVLGIDAGRGLLDLLVDPALTLEDVVLRTNVSKLSILPAGTTHHGAPELLASRVMARLLDDLAGADRERIVVFDAPPMLPSTDSRALAAQMGQVVLVVAAERTTHTDVEHAIAALQECPVVMTMLNQVTVSEVGNYYGRYGSRHDQPASPASHVGEAT